MKKKSIPFLPILFMTLFISNIFSQGIIFDKARYLTNDSWEESDLGFSSSISSKYSLRKFAPIPLIQEGSSCTGWATSYAAMSIIHNIIFDITDSNKKFIHSFDPNYIYSLLSEKEDYNCEEGTKIDDALETIEKYGCKKMFIPAYTSCNTKIDINSKRFGKPYKISNHLIPFFAKSEKMSIIEKTNEIKQKISSKNPVIIGAHVTNSIHSVEDSGAVDDNGLWPYNKNEEFTGAHAMCIIGYDDSKFGGCFEVMNSWGSDYGDNGFIWIRYNDLFKVTFAFYTIENFTPEKLQNNDYTCYWGDCYSDYSHISWIDGERYEGEFKDGRYHGTGIMSNDKLTYSGSFKNGLKHGYGLIYVYEENKYYDSDWRNGEVIDNDVLGFNEVQRSENDLKMKKLIDNFKISGIIKVEDENILDIMDFDSIPKIKKTKIIEH